MELEANQVSRLLEYAAAMSSAQEKVTGSPKLDMAGVMAALAMARQHEIGKKPSTASGQRSFLHDNYKRSDGLVRAEYVETSLEETVSSPGWSGLARSRNCSEQNSSHLALLSGNRGVQSDDSSSRSERRKVSECRAAFENITSNDKKSSISSSSSVESSPRQKNKWDQASTVNPPKSSVGVAKYINQANNDPETETARTGEMGGDMSGFLTVVEKLSSEKERRTGNGRLDMSELVSALNSFQSRPAPPSAPPPLPARLPPTSAGGLPRPPSTSAGGPPRPPSPPASVPKPSHAERQETCSATRPEHSQTMNTSKYSFQKSLLTENREHATSATHHASFTAEKNCLIGELKSKMNPESRESSSKEDSKQNKTLPRRNLQTVNPSQDQIVKKIVYNQYREMLNSYRNNK